MFRIGRSPDDRGFTLLELLVSMALLAIAASVLLAWMPDLEDRWAVDRAARQIERVLVNAAELAKVTGYDQIVSFQLSDRAPMLVFGDQTTVLDPTVELKWLGARELGANSGRSAIAFLGTGGASGGAVEIQRGQARSSIEIDWLSGSVRRRATADDGP
jgi:general secretion pathway protein H